MKVAVITGAASGIGLALSEVYLQRNNHVVMVDIDSNKLKDEAARLSSQFPGLVYPHVCDVTSSAEVTDLANKIKTQPGRIDWLYNNAGIIGDLGPVWELNPNNIKQVMEVNLFGMINVIQGFFPVLLEQNFRGHIINMASLYALCTGSQMASYSMSKHAVLALSESLYFDLTRLNKPIDVSVVVPSFTDTALLSKPSATNQNFHEALKSLLTRSRPALDVVTHIIQEVDQKQFYILPDKEVKAYCEERTNSILLQESPHRNNIEKLMHALMKRNSDSAAS